MITAQNIVNRLIYEHILPNLCQNTHSTYKILQYTCFNLIWCTCSYVKFIWDMSQHKTLSELQCARFRNSLFDSIFVVCWSDRIPDLYSTYTLHIQCEHLKLWPTTNWIYWFYMYSLYVSSGGVCCAGSTDGLSGQVAYIESKGCLPQGTAPQGLHWWLLLVVVINLSQLHCWWPVFILLYHCHCKVTRQVLPAPAMVTRCMLWPNA